MGLGFPRRKKLRYLVPYPRSVYVFFLFFSSNDTFSFRELLLSDLKLETGKW